MSPVTAPPAGDQLEQDVTDLLAYADEISLPGVTRDTARSLLRRRGDMRLAKRSLRDRRDRLGRQIEKSVDEEWLELETGKARAKDDTNTTDRERELARSRGRLTVVQRLTLALRQAGAMAAISTPDFVATGSAGGESTAVMPPGGDQDIAEHYLHLLELVTTAFERELDRARFGAQAESKEQRAARVVADYVGLPSWLVAALDRTCGSQYTVERDRHFLGVRMKDGLDHEPEPRRAER